MEFGSAIGLLGLVLAAVAAQSNDAVLNTALFAVAEGIGVWAIELIVALWTIPSRTYPPRMVQAGN